MGSHVPLAPGTLLHLYSSAVEGCKIEQPAILQILDVKMVQQPPTPGYPRQAKQPGNQAVKSSKPRCRILCNDGTHTSWVMLTTQLAQAADEGAIQRGMIVQFADLTSTHLLNKRVVIALAMEPLHQYGIIEHPISLYPDGSPLLDVVPILEGLGAGWANGSGARAAAPAPAPSANSTTDAGPLIKAGGAGVTTGLVPLAPGVLLHIYSGAAGAGIEQPVAMQVLDVEMVLPPPNLQQPDQQAGQSTKPRYRILCNDGTHMSWVMLTSQLAQAADEGAIQRGMIVQFTQLMYQVVKNKRVVIALAMEPLHQYGIIEHPISLYPDGSPPLDVVPILEGLGAGGANRSGTRAAAPAPAPSAIAGPTSAAGVAAGPPLLRPQQLQRQQQFEGPPHQPPPLQDGAPPPQQQHVGVRAFPGTNPAYGAPRANPYGGHGPGGNIMGHGGSLGAGAHLEVEPRPAEALQSATASNSFQDGGVAGNLDGMVRRLFMSDDADV